MKQTDDAEQSSSMQQVSVSVISGCIHRPAYSSSDLTRFMLAWSLRPMRTRRRVYKFRRVAGRRASIGRSSVVSVLDLVMQAGQTAGGHLLQPLART